MKIRPNVGAEGSQNYTHSDSTASPGLVHAEVKELLWKEGEPSAYKESEQGGPPRGKQRLFSEGKCLAE